MIAALLVQKTGRHLPELRMDEGEQLIAGAVVAPPPVGEPDGDLL